MTMTASLISDPVSDLFRAPDPIVFPRLTGRQAPHHLSVFDGDDTHGFKAITLAGRISHQPVMPWQCGHLRAILRQTLDGTWTHSDVVLLCARQNGKSEILLLRCIYGLFKLGEKILYTVQRWDTGQELHTRMVAMINSRPWLRRHLAAKPTLSQGRGKIVLKSGAQMITSTRSADVGRGITKIDLLIYDEAYNLDSAASAAVDYAQMASEDPQTIYTSSAVNAEQHAKGYVLSDMRAAGLQRSPGLYLAEHMAPEDMPTGAVATWEYANPSYGVIQTAAKVRKIFRKATTKGGLTSFGVEALGRGVWPVRSEDLPALISAETWADMGTGPVQLVGPIAVAVDMTPDRKTLAITASQWTTAGTVHLDLGYHGLYTAQAVKYIVDLVTRMDPCALVIDRQSPAASMEADLIAAGIEPTMTDTGQLAKATGDFYDKALAALLHHTLDPDLIDAVEGAVKRDLPGGGWAWDRKGADNDISPVVASSLALWGLLTFGANTAPVQTLVHRSTIAVRPHQTRSETTNLAAVGF